MHKYIFQDLYEWAGQQDSNARTTVTFCCQYADRVGLNPNRELFEDNAQYVRTALVTYNAVFDDMGDISKPEYLVRKEYGLICWQTFEENVRIRGNPFVRRIQGGIKKCVT